MNIDQENQNILQHIEEGNYHAAMNLAISAMNQCRREDNQPGVDYFIQTIKTIANAIAMEFGS
ncbi:MAG: hypothetical protein OEZ38_11820 [Gammaproteobacteria bacterium]|nr:hypothetical protein [Gammaproteobacteria bacterium]